MKLSKQREIMRDTRPRVFYRLWFDDRIIGLFDTLKEAEIERETVTRQIRGHHDLFIDRSK